MQLSEARSKRKVTQWDLTLKTGISQAKISLIERGYIKPKPHEKEKIAEALGYPVSEIFPATEAKNAAQLSSLGRAS